MYKILITFVNGSYVIDFGSDSGITIFTEFPDVVVDTVEDALPYLEERSCYEKKEDET